MKSAEEEESAASEGDVCSGVGEENNKRYELLVSVICLALIGAGDQSCAEYKD